MNVRKAIDITFYLLVGIFLTWLIVPIVYEFGTQLVLGPKVMEEFDFGYGTPYVRAGDRKREVLTVHPNNGGYLSRVGFRDGDIILMDSIASFYRLLIESKDEVVTVKVVDGGDGPPLEQRVVRTLVFRAQN